MIVNEIFRSIQGESTYSGLPCVFIRLTGCNLRCIYCDTKYAYCQGKKMSVTQVAKAVKKLYVKGDIIEITGGEPMLQKDEIEQLLGILPDAQVLIETNGSVLIPGKRHGWGNMWEYVKFIMDWKCPSSGMNDRMEYVNLERLDSDDELKFVIGSDEDYDEMKHILEKYEPTCKVLVSTVWDEENRKRVVEQILDDKLNVRFQIQIHKIVWDPAKRRV